MLSNDTTAPTLESLEVGPLSLASDGNYQFVVTARFADDISGIFDGKSADGTGGSSPQIRFVSPSGQIVDGLFDILNPVSGDRLDGVYTAIITLSPYAEAGTWRAEYLLLSDEAGNLSVQDPDASQLIAQATFTLSNENSDTTAPTLESLEVGPLSLASDGNYQFVVTARFADDISGIFDGESADGTGGSSPQIRFVSPSGQIVDGLFDILNPVSGDRLDGVYTAIITLSPYAEAGTWRAEYLLLSDEAGNLSVQDPDASQLIAQATFTLSNENSDTTAPTLESLEVGPLSLASDGNYQFVVTARFADDISGIFDGESADGTGGSSPQIRFVSPSGQIVDGLFDILNPVSGDRLDGVYTAIITLSPYAEAGTWRAEYLLLSDEAGNLSVQDPDASQLIAQATFTLSNENSTPVITSSPGATTFVEGNDVTVTSVPVVVDSAIMVFDADSSTLASGTVTITNYVAGQDVLGFANTTKISGVFDVFTGVLTLSAVPGQSPTVADWQAALRTVTYLNTSEMPDTTDRTISFALSDGSSINLPSEKILAVEAMNDAPAFKLGDGKTTTDFSGSYNDTGYSVTVQPDGKILVAGVSNGDFALVRYNADGSLDTSFDGDGKVTTNPLPPEFTWDDVGYSVILQPDSKIIVVGTMQKSGVSNCALVRYNPDGSLDTSFGGGDGKSGLPISVGRSAALQPNGKILIAGSSSVDAEFEVVRLNEDGNSLDTTFGSNGIVTTPVGLFADYAEGLAVQSDGKILLAGRSWNGTDYDYALVRYTPDGSLDTSFTGDGKLTSSIGLDYDQAFSVTLQPDGKILVAGDSYNGLNYDFALARYNVDGSQDQAFGGGDGKVTTVIGSSSATGYSVTVQPDGKILVAGVSNGDFALVRYNADGSLDTSFDGDGKVTTGFGFSYDSGYGVTIQPDGKILVVGTSYKIQPDAHHDFALVRYNLDGSLDGTFDAVNVLNGTLAYLENGAVVVLDADASIYDADLSALGDYVGATLTLSRSISASAEDFFSGTGNLGALTQGAALVVSDVNIGTITTNTGGILSLTFGVHATQGLVNETLRSIAYSNSSNNPPQSIQIDWVFSDGNAGAQGTGGALIATGSTTVNITAINDAPTAVPVVLTAIVEDSGARIISAAELLAGVSDGDGPSSTITSLTLAGGLGALVDNENGTWTYTPALNDDASVALNYTVSDGEFSAFSTASLDITAVNDAPSDISLSAASVQEFRARGTLVGTLSATDPDGGSSFTYTLLNNAGGRFALVDDQIRVANGLLLDFEQAASHQIQVRVADQDGLTRTETFTITVGNVDPETVSGNGAANIFVGGAKNDFLSGLSGSDTLKGQGGNDILDGGTGIDRLEGGAGNDTFVVDSARDQVVELLNQGTDTVRTSATFTLSANIENGLVIGTLARHLTGNTLANTLTGNGAANKLFGGAGNDSLNGGSGNDTLIGGSGRDSMTGGSGADDFDFNLVSEISNGATRDRIIDFQHLIDDIDLSTIDANGSAAGNTAFQFVAAEGAAFTGVKGQLRWVQIDAVGTARDKTLIEGDINGDRRADFQLELTGLKALTSADFML